VAYDVFAHLDGRYRRRILAYGIGGPALIWLWIQGVRYLMEHDTVNLGRRPRFRDLLRTARQGITPGYGLLLRSSWKFLLPTYHPDHEGNTAQAVAYLARSPAALRADALSDAAASAASRR
jgi:predicted metal-dependent hydrolase